MNQLALLRKTLFLLLFLLPLPAFAASQLTISSSGGGVFAVTGNLEAVAGLQIAISYDSTLLANPRVTPGDLITGHGMIAVPNATGNPIQIAAVGGSAVTASGTVATITFDTVSTSPAGITGFSGSGIGVNYKPVRVAFYNNAGSPVAASDPAAPSGSGSGNSDTASAGWSTAWTPADSGGSWNTGRSGSPTATAVTAGSNGTVNSAPSTTRGGTPVLGGTLSLPATDPGAAGQENRSSTGSATEQDNQPRPAVTEPKAAVAEKGSVLPETGAAEAPAPRVTAPPPQQIESVLERFRLFQGEKSVKTLCALFDRDPAAPFTQVPAIALADGVSTVKLVLSHLYGDEPPTFSLSSAQYVGLARIGEREWELEVRPEKGALKGSVKLFWKGGMQELPLTVTPKADISPGKKGAVDEADFQLFLKERGTAAAPRFDLNGDGKRDYLDDYIFTANYLVRSAEQASRKQATQQKP